MNFLPPELLSSLESLPGFDAASFREVHESGAQITSVRINPSKNIDVAVHFPGAEKITWSSGGYYLPQRPSFTVDPLFHAGAYYVQEASSLFLEEVLKQSIDLSKPLHVLDLCASPGGKSTLIQSIISGESLLVSNEVIKTRVTTLAENIIRWGAANVIVTNNDAKDLQRLPGFFDVIIADVPCSGSGLFRKDNNAISEWSVNNVELCCQRQQRILGDVLPSLKENGILVYSTCSYSQKEDEDIADILVADHQMESIELNVEQFPGIVSTRSAKQKCFGYRFYPDKIKGEGFFIAAFRKLAVAESKINKKNKFAEITKTEREQLLPYFKSTAQLSFIKQDEDILAFPSVLLHALGEIQNNLYIKRAGVKAGMLIRNELVPAHDLALSNLASEKFPVTEISLTDALDYLRKKEINLVMDMKGWSVVSYAQNNLGFIKILPGRTNNYYPKELRILNK